MQNFFEDYKKLEHKTVQVKEFQNAELAREIVAQSIVDYQKLIAEEGH
jgi:inorganic pyrophosphatase